MSKITDPALRDSTGQEIEFALLQLAGQYDTSDYKSIVAAVRRGDAEKIPNGASFEVPHAVYGNIEFVVRRKNVDKVAGDTDRPTLTIQPKYLLSVNGGSTAATFQYDRPEAFIPWTRRFLPVRCASSQHQLIVAGLQVHTTLLPLPLLLLVLSFASAATQVQR